MNTKTEIKEIHGSFEQECMSLDAAINSQKNKHGIFCMILHKKYLTQNDFLELSL